MIMLITHGHGLLRDLSSYHVVDAIVHVGLQFAYSTYGNSFKADCGPFAKSSFQMIFV